MVVIKGYGISSRPMNMNVQYKRIKIGKKYEKGATVNHEIYMEAHFLQLDTSSVKRLLVRRDEESVKVDQVFKTRKEIMKKDVIFYCFFCGMTIMMMMIYILCWSEAKFSTWVMPDRTDVETLNLLPM